MSLALAVIHIVVCFLLILIVLLQTGKGADIGAAFGGGSSQTLFGSAGPGGFLTKITTGVAIIFMVTSIGLAYFASHKTGASIIKDTRPKQTVPAPPPTPVEKGTPIAPAQPGPAPLTQPPAK
ncbi:MAG: preprotein translocase subunit SecG [Thermodesulfobacteriota bacterium]|nr:preprotein translocase subunit SecG [Thermodesulfobacteriota bacterium]